MAALRPSKCPEPYVLMGKGFSAVALASGGVDRAQAQVTEESGQVLCDCCRFLSRSKMPAARKDCPSLDVVHALQIRARWLTLGNGLVREDTKCRGRADVGAIDRIPTIVPIVTHRRGDGLGDPV